MSGRINAVFTATESTVKARSPSGGHAHSGLSRPPPAASSAGLLESEVPSCSDGRQVAPLVTGHSTGDQHRMCRDTSISHRAACSCRRASQASAGEALYAPPSSTQGTVAGMFLRISPGVLHTFPHREA